MALDHSKATPAQLRSFGRVFLVALGLIGGLTLYRGHVPLGAGLVGAGALFGLLGQVAPTTLLLPYRGWMRFGDALSAVTSRILLFVVYFGVVTPTALVLRILGKDPLSLRPPGHTTTYWQPREGVPPTAESYLNQF